MSEGGTKAAREAGEAGPRRQDIGAALRGLDSTRCAREVLAIVAYVTAADGPLQTSPDPSGTISPWHRRLLLKAMERLEIIDAFMRGRAAFLVAGRERGYYAPQQELDLAGVTLDACRAATSVVDGLLSGGLPAGHEFEAMCDAVLAINPALDALRELEERHGAD
jgi:hypothetical protein